MYNDNLKKILFDNIENGVDINSIPNIDLYMDQVLTFLDDGLKGYKRYENEKLLTKTMINNYAKDGLLIPPIKKKYTKEHIITLILIYHMKNTLSINDIRIITNSIKSLDDKAINNLYLKFTDLQKIQIDNSESEFNTLVNKISTLEPSSVEESNILTILCLLIEATEKKRMAEKMIDEILKKL